MNGSEKSDHELLIELHTKVDHLIKGFDNHLHHHWTYLVTVSSILGTGIVSLFCVLLSQMLKN